MRPRDVEVAKFAAGQHTMVSVAQLRGAGISNDGVKARLRAGRLHFVRRGVYSTVPPEHRSTGRSSRRRRQGSWRPGRARSSPTEARRRCGPSRSATREPST